VQLKEIKNWKLIICIGLANLCVCLYICIYVLRISKKTAHLARSVSEIELTSKTYNVACMWKRENMNHFKGICYEVIICTFVWMTMKLKSPGLVRYSRQ